MEMSTEPPVMEDDLAALDIDLDDEYRPRSLRECEEAMPEFIRRCEAQPEQAEAEAVCDWCRSLLAAHLREHGDAATVRQLLEDSLEAINLAGAQLPRERVTHFLDNIRFRIDVTNVLEQRGEEAVLELLTKRQIAMAERLINEQPAVQEAPPCPTPSAE
jgi:hypothetical protein